MLIITILKLYLSDASNYLKIWASRVQVLDTMTVVQTNIHTFKNEIVLSLREFNRHVGKNILINMKVYTKKWLWWKKCGSKNIVSFVMKSNYVLQILEFLEI